MVSPPTTPPRPLQPRAGSCTTVSYSSWARTPLPLFRRPIASPHRCLLPLLRSPPPFSPTLKSLKILTLDALSRTTYSFESALHTNSSAWPNDLLRHASAVYTMYSPSPHTVTKRPLGLCSRVYQGGEEGAF